MSASLSPALLLGALLSVVYASLYHLWSGRTLRDLLVAMIVAGAGFGFGQFLGNVTRASPWRIGELHVLEASIIAWMVLFVYHLLIGRPRHR